jgi:isopenicillin-N N-acyltransferase-like protein
MFGPSKCLLSLVYRSECPRISLLQPLDGCTSFARRVGEQQFLCQNWDWKSVIAESIIILHLIPAGGLPEIKVLTEAGIIGKIGLNSAGVGIALNAIKSPAMDSRLLPVHLLIRRLLQQRTVEECLAYVTAQQGCASAA